MSDDLDLGVTIKGFAAGQKVFNRYTLKKLLGRGGMGVVWLVRDEELGRDSAIKFLPEVVAADRAAIDDMKREVRRAIDLAHPNIIKTHDFLTDGRTAGVSMELIPGGTLSALRLEQPDKVFNHDQLAAWMRQLCQALEYAHETAEVVHRDLKPTNLMVDAKGRLKVVDFGIAASISDSVSRVSRQAGSSGTPVYMSPQQMMGEDPAVTDDIYAVGATLFELLTGKPPFHAGNIMLQVQGKVAPLVNERRRANNLPPIPYAWETTIAACLAKEAATRPPSAAALARMFQGEIAPAVVAPPVIEPPVQQPASPPPTPASPEKPTAANPEISGLRRWLLAPLVGAALPALAVYFFVAENDTNKGAFDPESMMLGLIWFGFVFVVALVLTAICQAANARLARGLVIFLGMVGTALGVLTAFFELETYYTVMSTILGGAGMAIAAYWLHAVGFGRPAGSAPLHAVWRLGQILGAGLVILHFGSTLPGAINADSAARRAAYEREERAQQEQRERQERIDAENKTKAEAAAKEAAAAARAAELARARERRGLESAAIIAEAFRMVFNRSPTAAERVSHMSLMIENADWDAARLRAHLRSTGIGQSQGRLLVPEEFPTIQEAIDAAVETTSDGNVVVIGPGRYSETLRILKNITLVGSGAGEAVVETGADECPLMVGGEARATIRGLTFRHTNTLVADSRMSVVALNDKAVVVFEGNTVRDGNGNAVHIKGSGRKIVRKNTIEGAAWAGVAIYGGTTSEVRDNILRNMGQPGIGLFEPVVSATITGNGSRNNRGSGIWIGHGDNCILENNEVSGNGTQGTYYGGIGLGEGRARLTGNKSMANIGAGIWWNQEKAFPIFRAGNISDGQPVAETR